MANYKKRFEIIKSTDAALDGVEVGGKYMGFGRSGGFAIDDADKARDIDAEWGIASRKRGRKDKVVVIPVDDKRVEKGHNYTFSALAMPWAHYDKLGHRVPEGNDNGKESLEEGREERIEEGRKEGAKARGQDTREGQVSDEGQDAHKGQDAYEGEGIT